MNKLPPLFIGQPLFWHDMSNHRTGYISEINDSKISIAWTDGKNTNMTSVSMFEGFISVAIDANMPPASAQAVGDLRAKNQKIEQQQIEATETARQILLSAKQVQSNELRKIMPVDAKAIIYAVRQKETSNTDYDHWGHSVKETILLAWSTHTRDLFSEMRKAALNYDSTASLKTDGIEHREKYSMGGGYYLSADDNRHGAGWVIRKQRLSFNKNPTIDQKLDGIPTGFNSIK